MTIRFVIFGVELASVTVELHPDDSPVKPEPSRKDKVRKSLAWSLIR